MSCHHNHHNLPPPSHMEASYPELNLTPGNKWVKGLTQVRRRVVVVVFRVLMALCSMNRAVWER